MYDRDLRANVRYNVSRIRRTFWIWGSLGLDPIGLHSWWSYFRRTESNRIEEIATIGLLDGQFNDECDITENDLRDEHGLNPRTNHFPLFPGWEDY